MQDWHTPRSTAEASAMERPLRLVPTTARLLPQRLAGRVDEHSSGASLCVRESVETSGPRSAGALIDADLVVRSDALGRVPLRCRFQLGRR